MASQRRKDPRCSNLRANALAASALAVALTGTAIAIAGLPHNSVGTKQIKKAAVHKSDIHKHAVSTSKLDTGVLRMQGIASNARFSGSIPTNTPEFSLADTQLTITRAGRVFGFARGAYSATCNVGNARVGLYLDGVRWAAAARHWCPVPDRPSSTSGA